MRARVIASLIIAALSMSAAAQQSVTQEKGFAADKVFQFGDIDAINTFNGNLTVRIPLGPTYPVNASLSYGLTLTYNSKVWDYEKTPGSTVRATPNRRSGAGRWWAGPPLPGSWT